MYQSRGYGFDFDEIKERARWQEFVIWRFLVKIVHPVQQIAAADAPDTADDEDHGHDHGRPGRGKSDVLLEVGNHVDLEGGVHGEGTRQVAREQPELPGAEHRMVIAAPLAQPL